MQQQNRLWAEEDRGLVVLSGLAYIGSFTRSGQEVPMDSLHAFHDVELEYIYLVMESRFMRF